MRTAKKTIKFITPYLYVAPIVFFAVGFSYVPFARTVIFSVSRVNRQAQVLEFVGLANFISIFQREDFLISLQNTVRLMLMYVPLSLLLATSLALLVNKKRFLSAVPEVVFSVPMAVSMATASLLFKVILNPTIGVVNSLLGIDFRWFQDHNHAMIGILVIHLWVGLAFDFLLMLVALRSVPSGLLEAANLDGAGFIKRFFHIQLPLIMPTVFFIMCANIILSMMTSTPILVITEGGPFRSTQTLVYSMFVFGYQSQNYSIAAVFSITVFLITFLFILLAFRLDKKVYYSNE